MGEGTGGGILPQARGMDKRGGPGLASGGGAPLPARARVERDLVLRGPAGMYRPPALHARVRPAIRLRAAPRRAGAFRPRRRQPVPGGRSRAIRLRPGLPAILPRPPSPRSRGSARTCSRAVSTPSSSTSAADGGGAGPLPAPPSSSPPPRGTPAPAPGCGSRGRRTGRRGGRGRSDPRPHGRTLARPCPPGARSSGRTRRSRRTRRRRGEWASSPPPALGRPGARTSGCMKKAAFQGQTKKLKSAAGDSKTVLFLYQNLFGFFEPAN